MQLTKERLERAATENQFMNGKIAAINVRLALRLVTSYQALFRQSYRRYLDEAIAENFPELEPVLKEKALESSPQE